VRDRDLTVTRDGPKASPIRVLVVGVIHGNETAGRPIVQRLRHHPPTQLKLWTVNQLNPDGDAANTRQNAHGVDLNRNFPADWRHDGSPGSTYYSGPRPASEPETRAAMKLIRRVEPDVTVWYHQAMNIVVSASGADKRRVLHRYAGVANMRIDDVPGIHGNVTRWQNRRFGNSSAFVVELPAGQLSRSAVKRHAEAVLAAGRAAQ
jgi:murein peptide amidase A